MILVDTSVWVGFFRGIDRLAGERLGELLARDEVALCAPVWIELLSGLSRAERPRLRKLLSALPRLYPDRSTWVLTEQWAERASRAGDRFGVGDLLVAAIAAEHDVEIWSLDGDFERMERLGFIRRHRPDLALR